MNNLDLLQILTSYKEKVASMSDEERRKLYLTISSEGDSDPETQALVACILDEIGKYLLPSKAGLFHDAEYYVFECQWVGEHIAVSPAHGYEVKWGDRPESKWLYTPGQFMQKFFPGDGRS